MPLTLMTCFSSLLVSAIFKSRQRVASNTSNENTRLKQDIRFAVTSFAMNLIFFILNLPVSLVYLLPGAIGSDILYFLAFYFYFISYAINFYIMISTNRIFREQYFSLYCKATTPINNQLNGTRKNVINDSIELTIKNTRARHAVTTRNE